MSEISYTPGAQNSPFGLLNANPEGSNYANESGFGATETNLLRKAIRYAIFDAAPAQYDALKLVFARSPMEKDSDEFEYNETTFGRSPIQAAALAAAVAASPGNVVTQAITLTAASLNRITPDLVILYPDNSEGVIQSIAGAVITVGSRTSASLPAVAANDVFAIRSTIKGDGMDYFSNYDRTETITRYNYIQFFARARRWAKVELQKYINTGTTNYLNVDKNEKLKQLRTDLFNSYFNGHRGEYQISNSLIAKSMGGIYPTMQAAGSMSANPTLSGLQAAFEALAFSTNYKKSGATRFLYATDEMLNEFSKIYKRSLTRYEPSNEIANLKLSQIEFGTQKWVLVNCELFREASCFPAEWRKRIIALDQEAVFPVKMKGIPAMDMGSTLDRGKNGTREDFKDWYVEAQLSLEFNNPLGSFWMDVA